MAKQPETIDQTDGNEGQAIQAVQYEAHALNVTKVAELAAKLKTAKPGVDIATAYLEFENPGDKFRGIYLGMKKQNVADPVTKEVKQLDCVCFMDESQSTFSNAGASLVRTMQETAIAQYSMVEIEYKGEKKTSGANKMKVYAVRPMIEGD